MEKLESVINWIWNVAKTTEKALINEKYIVEYKYFKGKLPKRMTDLIRKYSVVSVSGYSLTLGKYKIFAQSFKRYKTEPNVWSFSIHNELEVKALLNGKKVYSESDLM
jgi:hypothetical protein